MKNKIITKEKGRVPKSRFPAFRASGNWDVKTLGDISAPVLDKVGDLALLTVSITAGCGFVTQKSKFGRDISGNQYKNYILLTKGEFSYNKGNSKKYPQGCIYELKEFEQVAAPSAFISFRLNPGYVSDFYQNLFETNYHGVQLKRFITSGARSDGLLNIRPEDFFSIQMPAPKESEQQKIADCLTSLDGLISAESQRLDALKDHKKGLMQDLFPAEGETVPKMRFPGFRGDWEESSLGEVVEYENGKAHENDISETGKFIVVNSKFISTEGNIRKFTDNGYCLADKENILMVLSDVPNGRAIAKCFFAETNNKYTVNQRICKLTAKNSVSRMLFYIIDRNAYFLAFDDGVKQTNLRKEDVVSCPLRLPSDLKEQQKIADCLSFLDNLIIAQTNKINALKLHKKGLMQCLFPSAHEVNR